MWHKVWHAKCQSGNRVAAARLLPQQWAALATLEAHSCKLNHIRQRSPISVIDAKRVGAGTPGWVGC